MFSKRVFKMGSIRTKVAIIVFVGSPKEVKRKTKNSATRQETPPPPIPPESFLLHLGVTARTHSIREFNKMFPLAVDKYVIDQ